MVKLYSIHKSDNGLYLKEDKNLMEDLITENDTLKLNDVLEETLELEDNIQEHQYVIGFKGVGIVGVFLLSVGNDETCYIYSKELSEFLLLFGAKKFIMAHNHPNGNIKPSQSDYNSFRAIKMVADVVESEFYDYMVVGGGKFYSVKNNDENFLFEEEDN